MDSNNKRDASVDFGALPPEINSARMYAGAGAAPMLAAAAAWNGIADELLTAASSFDAVIVQLSTDAWVSSASLSMVAAAQPLLAWMAGTADSSARAAAQALSSVAAYEAAFAMTVPPAEVAANRAQLAALTEANIFGQNTSAIAMTEARYSEMWARDASAMYGYAASSAAAGQLNPLSSPSPSTNPAGIAAQEGLVNLISQGPGAVQSLAAPAAPETTGSTLTELIMWFDRTEFWWADEFDHNRATYYDYSIGQIGSGGNDDDDEIEEIAAAAAKPVVAANPVRPTRMVAGMGNAHSVGHLAVPARWSDSQPAAPAAPAVRGTYWTVPEPDAVEATPLAPGMAAASARSGIWAGPRYGVRPVVMPKQGIF